MPQTLGFQGLLPNPADAIDRLNPIGWWRLNDSSGSTAVATVGNDGTYVGSPTLEAGPLAIDGQSVEFDDGPTQKYTTVPAQTGDINAATNAFTVSAFFYANSFPATGGYIWEEGASGAGCAIYVVDDSGTPRITGLAYASSTAVSRIDYDGVSASTLYHVAYGYDSTGPTTVLYINGDSVGTVQTNTGTSIPSHGGANGIGGVNGGARFDTIAVSGADADRRSFDGRIGDVARFSGLLTQDEVRSIARQNMAI